MHFLHSALKLTRRTLAIGFTLLTAVAVAQNAPGDVCTTTVRTALQAANESCSGTSRNQVCYGNVLGQVTPAEGVTDVTFEQVGDTAALEQIQALQLSPLDEAAEQWGVALMQLQANLPDTLPGQNVTFLLFGDVTIEEEIGEQARLDASVNTAANLRLAPSATSPVVGSVAADAPVTATGKTVNQLGETWIRVRYEDYRTATGWILAELVDGDLTALPDVPSDSLTLNPMQAFYFKTGIGQTQCAEAPTSGVVVQTPQGAGKVNFTVNGIDIALGSTAFLSSPESIDNTCLSLLTGDADLTSGGRVIDLNPGERSCTPLNDDGTSGPPGAPEPFDPQEIESIAAVVESLPDEVEIPDPAPTRTPTALPTTVPPTAVPTALPTAVPPTAVSTALPTDVTPLPTHTATSIPPTATPTTVTRYVNISQSRTAADVTLSADAGPDAPSSYAWHYVWNETPVDPTGQSIVLQLGPGAQVSVDLTVCWPDGGCLTANTIAAVPACAVDTSKSASITLHYEGGGEYVVQKTNEDCVFGDVGPVGQSSPTFSSSVQAGETWRVINPSDPSMVVWGERVFDFNTQPTPVDEYVNDPFMTPEVTFPARALRATATPEMP
jgi:hypothetical protein